MHVHSLLSLPSLCALTLLLTSACAGSGGSATPSSGTPVNPFSNPGAADLPSAPLTGAQPRQD